MNISKKDLLIIGGIAAASAVVSGFGTYFIAKAVNNRALKRSVTRDTHGVSLTDAERSANVKFMDLYKSIPSDVEFERSWQSTDGLMRGIIVNDLKPGVYRSVDVHGRRVVMLVGASGETTAIFQRYADDFTNVQVVSLSSNGSVIMDRIVETVISEVSELVSRATVMPADNNESAQAA